MPDRDAAAQAAVAAAKLALGATLEGVSLALAVVALVGCALAGPAALIAVLVSLGLGMAQLVYSLRVRFDRQIFASWAAGWQHADAQPGADMAAFDVSIGRRGGQRGLAARVAGAVGLLHRQTALLAAQALALGVAAILMKW